MPPLAALSGPVRRRRCVRGVATQRNFAVRTKIVLNVSVRRAVGPETDGPIKRKRWYTYGIGFKAFETADMSRYKCAPPNDAPGERYFGILRSPRRRVHLSRKIDSVVRPERKYVAPDCRGNVDFGHLPPPPTRKSDHAMNNFDATVQ